MCSPLGEGALPAPYNTNAAFPCLWCAAYRPSPQTRVDTKAKIFPLYHLPPAYPFRRLIHLLPATILLRSPLFVLALPYEQVLC